MTTISLRTLVREPIKVKRMTRAGKPIQVTDNGKPLWILHPASAPDDEKERLRVTDETMLDVTVDMETSLSLAARLSTAHTERLSARAIDLLHVSCALEPDSELFMTTDHRQAELARVEGLKVIFPG